MRKVAILFVLAVLVPSVVLALLAGRTLSDQQFVLERQQTLLYQTLTDCFAKEINDFLAEQPRQFIAIVESLVTMPNRASPPRSLTTNCAPTGHSPKWGLP